MYVGGHDRAPHAPRRSERPGEPGALLDPSRAHGFRWRATTGPPTPPDARSAPGNPARSSGLRSLADPFHVAVDGHLAHRHDLASLDHDEPRAVGRPVVLARVRERRGDPPGVELPQALERLLEGLAG